jgi:Sec-independent protein translocase protein TatA
MPQQLPLEEEIDDFYEHLIDLFGRDVYKVTHPLHRAFRQYQEIKKEMESESESEDEDESEEESEHESENEYDSD